MIDAMTREQLRVADLTAKIAKVTLRDTIRVLIAAGMLSRYFGRPMEDIITEEELTIDRATPENVAACEQAFFDLEQTAAQDPKMRAAARALRKFIPVRETCNSHEDQAA